MKEDIDSLYKSFRVGSLIICMLTIISWMCTDKQSILNPLIIFLLIITICLNVIFSIWRDRVLQKDSEYRRFLIKEIEEQEGSENKGNGENTNKFGEDINFTEKKVEQKDILMQMLKNNDETTDYFKISKRQAQSSFWFSIISCIIGIIMICLSLYAIFKIEDMQFAIIGIVGGTITELIAGTVLVIHNKSALQLNYYYDALHENEKFLSAINLADKLEDTEKTQMYIEVIRAQIEQTNKKEKDKNN